MKVIARLLIFCIIAALVLVGFYAFTVIDNTAKNTASYLSDQTAFAYNSESIVILNNEISFP